VDTLDFNFLAANFGTASGTVWAQGDFNYDGSVDTTDFNLLAANFNATLGTNPFSATVPEPPAAAILAAIAVLARAVRRS
jgi:hypothetical protein